MMQVSPDAVIVSATSIAFWCVVAVVVVLSIRAITRK